MDRLFGALLAILNSLASIWVLFLIALISSDVIGRAAFDLPVPGVPEIVKCSMVGMVWLWMAYTLRAGRHLRTTLVLAILPHLGQRVVLILNSLIGAAMFAMIAWLGWFQFVTSWTIGAFEGEHPVRVPTWPVWGILVLGATLTAIQYLLDAWRFSRDALNPGDVSDTAELTSDTVELTGV